MVLLDSDQQVQHPTRLPSNNIQYWNAVSIVTVTAIRTLA
jgi:hypothetical protein